MLVLESLSNNVLTDTKTRCFKLYSAYSISFISSNVGNFFWSWILKDCIEVQEKKKGSRCLVFMSSKKREIRQFHVVVVQWRQTEKMYKKAWYACKVVVLPESKPVAFVTFLLTSPSSLLKLKHLLIETIAAVYRNSFFFLENVFAQSDLKTCTRLVLLDVYVLIL